jgi:Flp pilus assembly protein CpaB
MASLIPRARAVVLVGLAVAVATAVYAAVTSSTAAGPPPVSILVATRDIQIAEPITTSMVAVRQVPAGALLGPSVALASDLGQVLASSAREPIYAGEPINRVRLFGPGLSVNAAPEEALVRRGYALYTVAASPLNMPLSGLRPGDHVAVLATLNQAPAPAEAAGGSSLRTSQLVVQPIDPSALVTFVNPAAGALTLAVPKRELATLAFLNREGALSFAQVRPDDPTGPMSGLTAPIFERLYHVPAH